MYYSTQQQLPEPVSPSHHWQLPSADSSPASSCQGGEDSLLSYALALFSWQSVMHSLLLFGSRTQTGSTTSSSSPQTWVRGLYIPASSLHHSQHLSTVVGLTHTKHLSNIYTVSSSDHAVSASTTYLIRSLGTVWGVSITSAIVQTTLSIRLPAALSGVPDKWKVRVRKIYSFNTSVSISKV